VSETLTTRSFFDGHILHGPTELHLQDGVIQKLTPYSGTAEFSLVAPGFLDLQMNGFESIDVSDCSSEDLISLDRSLLSHGTTHWLATVITAPLDRLGERIAFLDEVCRSGQVPGLLGIHIEGPFLGQAPGAHRADWIVPIDMDWVDALPESVRLVTIAPEQQMASQATELLTQRGVAVSMGHSRPSRSEMESMVAAGASMVTHLFNGMSGVHHRETGLALRALVDERITAGLIADMSHVSSDAVALAFAAKGGHGVCLVSDTVAWNTERAKRRGIQIVHGSPQLADGTLAGSSTPLSQCVQRTVHEAGVGLEEVLKAATLTPSKVIHRPLLSQVREGVAINLLAMDDALCVVGAWRALVSHRA
jgi:N-acetylglucosamine-6-phosphate deacetylase